MGDRPYTDDDLDRATDAMWQGIPAERSNELWVVCQSDARAVLDAVAADIARRERESIVAWVKSPTERIGALLEDDHRTIGRDGRLILDWIADAIEAHADREAT